jgi:2-polyprenyl-3-methyl-5-hydroxy-6-metoxy-1,4-benzoquinol methylase
MLFKLLTSSTPIRKDVFRVDIGKRWFRCSGAGWHPGLYEWFFESTRMGSKLRTREEELVYGFLGNVLGSDQSILEFGPGTGHYTVPLARRCARVVTVEVSETMQEYLRERLDREGLVNVETRPGRLQDGVDATEKFDGVLVMGPLFYVRDLEEGLTVLKAALKPGGWTIFTVPMQTPEGWLHALNELVARRRVYLRSPEETIEMAKKIGLKVEGTGKVGTGRRGLTLVVRARA